MAFHPYLNFGGDCRAAFERYHDVFGGDLVLLRMGDGPTDTAVPAEQADLILHAALRFEDDVLMGSDAPPGEFHAAEGMYVNYDVADVAEARRVFVELADGGTVTMPMTETFWSPAFGMCVDRWGTPWMVSAARPEDA
jgi:PhnB protein